jgi:hypothetical protein
MLSERYAALRARLRGERLAHERARLCAELAAGALSTLAGYVLYAIVAVRARAGA